MEDEGIILRIIFGAQIPAGDTNATDASERVRRELIRMRRHRLKRRIFSHFEELYLRKLEIAIRLEINFTNCVASVRNILVFILEKIAILNIFAFPYFLTMVL